MLKKPCGTFDETYAQDIACIRTPFRGGLLILLFLFLFVILPLTADDYVLGIMNMIGSHRDCHAGAADHPDRLPWSDQYRPCGIYCRGCLYQCYSV